MTSSLLDARRTAWFATTSHAEGVGLVRTVLERCGSLPDVDVRASGVRVVTDDDAAAEAVAGLGLVADPSVLQRLSVLVDARDVEAVASFWREVSGYDAAPEGLADPLRRDPAIRVREVADDRPLRNRLHLDVSRPHELARASARQVAPDRVPTGEEWPYFLNVADVEGNEADLVPLVPDDRFEDAGADDWRRVFGAKVLYRGDDAALVDAAAEVADVADDAGIAVMIDLRAGLLVVDSGKDRWEADGFVALAMAVQAAARRRGLVADPDAVGFVQVGLDAVDVPAVREFWRAVLGYEHDPREGLTDIVHPHLLDVPLFFQPMEADDTARREQRGRMQLRLDVPRDQAARRIETARAAGGAVLEADEDAGRWVVADPEGNELHLHAGTR